MNSGWNRGGDDFHLTANSLGQENYQNLLDLSSLKWSGVPRISYENKHRWVKSLQGPSRAFIS